VNLLLLETQKDKIAASSCGRFSISPKVYSFLKLKDQGDWCARDSSWAAKVGSYLPASLIGQFACDAQLCWVALAVNSVYIFKLVVTVKEFRSLLSANSVRNCHGIYTTIDDFENSKLSVPVTLELKIVS